MTYRKLPTKVALEIMEWADKHNIEYDIWNAMDSFTGNSPYTEIGLSNWDQVEFLLQKESK